jgi:hypothetical protein
MDDDIPRQLISFIGEKVVYVGSHGRNVSFNQIDSVLIEKSYSRLLKTWSVFFVIFLLSLAFYRWVDWWQASLLLATSLVLVVLCRKDLIKPKNVLIVKAANFRHSVFSSQDAELVGKIKILIEKKIASSL